MKKPLTRFLAFLSSSRWCRRRMPLPVGRSLLGQGGEDVRLRWRGNFATKSQCESYRTSVRVRVDELLLQRVRPPKPTVAPRRPIGRPPGSRVARRAQQPDPRRLRHSVCRRKWLQTARADCRHGTGGRRDAAAAIRQGKGSLASDLRNRLNASAPRGQALSDVGSPGGPGSPEGRSAGAKSYADYSIGPGGQVRPGVPCGAIPAIPMPQGVAIVDDDKCAGWKSKCGSTRIATLYGKREEARATAEKKRAAVETLEKISGTRPTQRQSRRQTPSWPRRKNLAMPWMKTKGHGGDQQGEKEWKTSTTQSACRADPARRIGRQQRARENRNHPQGRTY